MDRFETEPERQAGVSFQRQRSERTVARSPRTTIGASSRPDRTYNPDPMIVLTELDERSPPSPSARDLQASTEAARLLVGRVYHIPSSFDACGSAEAALWHVPAAAAPTPGVWIGYIPSAERYAAVYAAALARNIRLVNDPEQFETAMELDRAYPLLEGLTPESVVVADVEHAAEAGRRLGFPIFVKGAVRSRKELGWRACVAADAGELATLVGDLLRSEHRSRGRVVLRRLVRLRLARTSELGFPLGREYRVFLYRGQPLEYGYYWEGDDPLCQLSSAEESAVLKLAATAAGRLGVPYLALDIGQLESGDWIVIEPGDGQFAGLSQVEPLRLWNKLLHAVGEQASVE